MTTELLICIVFSLTSAFLTLFGIVVYFTPLHRLFGKNGRRFADSLILRSFFVFVLSVLGIYLCIFIAYW